ncbi:MAG: M28 family peptidase [Flavobacteriales bacterium]|nr:M28 family peptidase [Flavobacteriales bacterium]NNK81390.1 M28 family peptidase [Flavobacteriales bacterium]
MRRIQFMGVVAIISLWSYGQDSLAMRYANEITENRIKEHLVEISSDEYEGRESGYKGQKMCEEYMVEFYKTLGLPPVKGSYVQEFELSLNDPSRVMMKQDNKEYSFLQDYFYYPGTTDRRIEAEIYYSGYGIADKKYTDINVFDLEDKAVIIWSGEPIMEGGKFKISGTNEPSTWSTNNDKKRELIEDAGAKAMLIIHPDYESKAKQMGRYFSHKGMSLKSDDKKERKNMPVFHISQQMGEDLLGAKVMKKAIKARDKGKVKSIGLEKKIEIEFARRTELLVSSNVMGYIEGGDKKDEVVIITAHYDHIGVDGEEIYNGADDDGSGTAATMVIAQAFAQAKEEGNGPRRSVMILNVSAEEKGLLGSRFYTENPVLPLQSTVANLNIDMIGRVDEQHDGNENYVYLIGADRLSQDLHDVGEKVNSEYCGLELDYTFNAEDDPNKFYYRSDHYNFAKNNVPAVFYFSGVHEDYHKPGDTVDKIMFPKLTRITKLIFHTAWDIANREDRLRLNSQD